MLTTLYLTFFSDSDGKKDGREWQYCLISLPPKIAREIQNTNPLDYFTLGIHDLGGLSFGRLKIVKEIKKRDHQLLRKDHRELEITFHSPKLTERLDLENLYLKRIKARMALMTDEELKKEIQNI